LAYADLLLEESAESQMLVVLSPRRRPTNFVVHSGSVYVTDFDWGGVVAVSVTGDQLTAGGSSALGAGQFYYDTDLQKLYVRTSGGVDPDTLITIATYEIYVATKDEHWYRTPDDATTRVVYYEPLVVRSPVLKATISDTLFGYMPVQTAQIALSNAPHIFEKHVYDSSFNKASIRIYHALREHVAADLQIDNVRLIYDGLMSDVSFSDGDLRIKTFSGVDELRQFFRNDNDSFYDSVHFPELDPNFSGKPIRYVYGVVDGFVPVNIDFLNDQPTTSDNRVFSVIGEQNNLANITKTVAASPASTTTRTYLNSVTGLRVGDSVWMDRAVGTDEYVEITVVNVSPAYIEHAALATQMASGDAVKRSFVGAVTIIQQQVAYKAMYGRDYTTAAVLAGGCAGFTLSSSIETDLAIPETFSPNDRVFCRVYGRTNDVTLGGPSFGSNDTESGNITHPAVIILDILKRVLGIPESRINAASFTQLLSDRTDALGFAIPTNSTGGFEEVKNTLVDVLKSSLIKLFVDDDHKWAVSAIGPLPVDDKTIDDTEITKGSFDYNFDYSDIVSDVIVEYAQREIGDRIDASNTVKSVTVTNNLTRYLHNVEAQMTFASLHFKDLDAGVLAERVSFIFGDRAGKVSFQTKNKFFDTEIDVTIGISRTKMPGFDFDADIERQRSFSVTGTQKGLRSVTIELDDQKGIQDNEGSW
jgi:hypothetical protein